MTERFRELDGLRGIAAVAVVGLHFTGTFDEFFHGYQPPPFVVWWGGYGVQLFFLISGFVILMTAERATVPTDFVISRVTRLYPAYWIAVTLAVVLVRVFAVPTEATGLRDTLLNYTMVQRWFQVPNVDGVYWTLAVEMQFYILIFALQVVTRCRISQRLLFLVVAAWCAVALGTAIWAAPFTRGIAANAVATLPKIVINVTLAEYGPMFCAGMLAFKARRQPRLWAAAWAVGALGAFVAWWMHDLTEGIIVAAVVVAFMIVAFRRSTPVLTSRPFRFYGKISYSLYITHSITGWIVLAFLTPLVGRIAAMVGAFVVVTLLAWAVHEVGEVRLTQRAKAYLQGLQRRRLHSAEPS